MTIISEFALKQQALNIRINNALDKGDVGGISVEDQELLKNLIISSEAIVARLEVVLGVNRARR